MADIILSRASRNTLLSLRDNKFFTRRTSKRLTTGLAVAEPIDNAVKYFQAKALSDRAFDLMGRKDSIDQGVSALQAALRATTSAEKLIANMKGMLSTAVEKSKQERGGFSGELDELKKQISNLFRDASYKGLNLLTSDSARLKVRFSEVKTSFLEVNGYNLNASSFYVDQDNNNLYGTIGSEYDAKLQTWSSDQAVVAARELVDDHIDELRDYYTTAGTAGNAGQSFRTSTDQDDVNARNAIYALIVRWEQNGNRTEEVAALREMINYQLEAGVTQVVTPSLQAAFDRVRADVAVQERYNALQAYLALDADAAGTATVSTDQETRLIALVNQNRGDSVLAGYLDNLLGLDRNAANNPAPVLTDSGRNALESLLESMAEEHVLKADGLTEILKFSKNLSQYLLTGDNNEASQFNLEVERATEYLDATLAELQAKSSTFANSVNILQVRSEFTQKYVDVLEEGSDKLVLANEDEESANLLSLRTRQQLSIQNLAIADQFQQSILQLFR